MCQVLVGLDTPSCQAYDCRFGRVEVISDSFFTTHITLVAGAVAVAVSMSKPDVSIKVRGRGEEAVVGFNFIVNV